ncbi:MAG: alpha/beta fold hydrolase [Pseudomonadota bacterium]
MNFPIKIVALVAATMLAGASTSLAQKSPASSDWASKTVPIDVFAQFPMINQPSMSPDGRWIASRIRLNGAQVLAIVPVKKTDGKIEIIAQTGEATNDKEGDRQIAGYRWADPDHLLITFSTREFFYDRWIDNVRYASYNRLTKKVIPMGWDEALGPTQALWVSNSGKPHMLLQRIHWQSGTTRTPTADSFRNPEVVDIDLDTGAVTTAMPPSSVVDSWDADSDGVVRIGVARDADSGKMQVYYRAAAGQQIKRIFDGTPDRYDELSIPAMIASRGGKAYAYGRSDGYRALYEFDLATMKLGKKVFGVPGYDIDGAALTPDRTSLLGVSYTSGRTQMEYFDPRLKEIQGILEDEFGKGNVLIATTDAKRETILFRVARMGQAETWYLFDTVTGAMGRFAYANDTLKDAMLNPVSVVSYPTSDGKKIEAILTMPRHRMGQKNLPLIVLPHGGPWARDDADWDAYGWAQTLAEQGYVVIQPNYRGSTGYGRDWEKASEKAWGYRMQDDLNDAIPWLAGQGIVDPKRVCMFGWSYGGYAASRAAERDGDKYRCAISGAGVHDLVAMQKYDKSYLGLYGAKMGMGSASGDLVDASPGLHPEKYSIPILIVQGAKDVRVPPAQARDLVARLKKAGKIEGKDFFYLEQPLNTHNLLREADRIQLMQEVVKFLTRFNPA